MIPVAPAHLFPLRVQFKTMPEPAFSDTIVFQSSLVRIGAFRCGLGYPGFEDTGPANHDCFVFPRTAVGIEHEHEPPFAANPNIVTFYNRGQRYLRHPVSQQGDRCDWFGIDRTLLRDAVRLFHGVEPENPFAWTKGVCNSRTYLHQRRIFEAARATRLPPMAVEELVIGLLELVIPGARPPTQTSDDRRHRELAHCVESLIGARFDQSLRLTEIAAAAGTSVFHLCRVFCRITGFTIHSYLKQLRVRHGLERISIPRSSMSAVALDLGFSHHSHFSSAFRREFGATPSSIRRQLTSAESRC